MESLMKELEALLKQDGLSFLMPVIGFYCQKCEEFIGDLNCVENHAAIHRQSNSSSQKLKMDKHAEDRKGHSHHFYNSPQQPHPSDHRDHPGDHKDPGDHRSHRDHQQDWRSHRAGQGNISLIEEMRKERMLITVSRGRTPPPNMRVKEEVDEEQTIGSKVKVEETDSKGNSSKSSREKADKGDSSDGSDNDKGRTPKGKVHKKKKKKEKKKKKDKS